jgi:hypothetical protein
MSLSSTTVSSLAAMPDRLEAAFLLVPPERRAWIPPSWEGIPGERFSPVGQVCHVRDIEIDGYHVRIARMLDEERPDLVSLDGYELAGKRNYEATDARDALAAFRAARGATVKLLAGLTPVQLDRRGTFAEYGDLSLRSLVHYLSMHDSLHLACLDWLLGQLHSSEPA